MQRFWKADPRKVRELLAALEGALSGLGYVRKRSVLTRVREPGVVHLFEVVRFQGAFVVNAGVAFEEVLQVARDAGDEWYLFSGDDPRREEAEERIARQARDTGLTFWLVPVVTAAIIARHDGLLELAREILASEAAAVRPHRPLHADFLVKVMNLLGVAPK